MAPPSVCKGNLQDLHKLSCAALTVHPTWSAWLPDAMALRARCMRSEKGESSDVSSIGDFSSASAASLSGRHADMQLAAAGPVQMPVAPIQQAHAIQLSRAGGLHERHCDALTLTLHLALAPLWALLWPEGEESGLLAIKAAPWIRVEQGKDSTQKRIAEVSKALETCLAPCWLLSGGWIAGILAAAGLPLVAAVFGHLSEEPSRCELAHRLWDSRAARRLWHAQMQMCWRRTSLTLPPCCLAIYVASEQVN